MMTRQETATMDIEQPTPASARPPPIYIVSGGVGASGEQVVRTALAQFDGADVPVVVVPRVRRPDELAAVVGEAAAAGGTIVHTLVDAELRGALAQLARARRVTAIDLMGDLLARLTGVLGRKPSGRPGRYRQLHQAYFDRVRAIEFAVAHDDGRNPSGWPEADLLLVGVSRSGKTPLSMYLAVQGWKVANLPLIGELPPPPELFQLAPRRVVGLTIAPAQLSLHRVRRQRLLGLPTDAAYAAPAAIAAEVAAARRLCRRHGFAVIDVTDRTIEDCAAEIMPLIGEPPPAP
jgi:regulator of PEP synthase PpsR (kinase-PPPase family)